MAIKGYKAMYYNKEENMYYCRNKEYKVGEIATEEGEPVPCIQGIHFCQKLIDVFSYYPFDLEEIESGRLVVAEVSLPRRGMPELTCIKDLDKCVTNALHIERILTVKEVYELANEGENNRGIGNKGDCNRGNYNKGDNNVGSNNKGDDNVGNFNKGDCNRGNYNKGDDNIGNFNKGGCNRGDSNVGSNNVGNFNKGDCNRGDSNVGSNNVGDNNVGDNNKGDYNEGSNNVGDNNKGRQKGQSKKT
jgi:hypothetical protein